MAEDEAVEAPADGVDVPASTGDEPAPPTTSLKERIKRPAKPEETELKLQTGSLNDEIQKAKSRIEQIKEEIASKTSNRQKGSDEQQRVKSALSELRGQFQSELVSSQALSACDTNRTSCCHTGSISLRAQVLALGMYCLAAQKKFPGRPTAFSAVAAGPQVYHFAETGAAICNRRERNRRSELSWTPTGQLVTPWSSSSERCGPSASTCQ